MDGDTGQGAVAIEEFIMLKKRTPKRKRPKSATSPLVDREQACEALNCSYNTIRRMEDDGTLKPVRLREGGKVYYRKTKVYALAGVAA